MTDADTLDALRRYLRIRTDHPLPDYAGAVGYLRTLCTRAGMTSVTHTLVAAKPILLCTRSGTATEGGGEGGGARGVLLNSHTDVVPAEAAKWSVPPFAAAELNGSIYARGVQDMKTIGIQYIAAVSRLPPLPRPIYLSFVPDEEIGGIDGMGALVDSLHFPPLRVGVALDEGLPTPTSRLRLFTGERQPWWVSIRVTGSPGHGATLPPSTAAGRLGAVLAAVAAYRGEQATRMGPPVKASLGEVVGVNVVYLNAGVANPAVPAGYAMNMIPSSAEAGLDVRVPPTVAAADVEAAILRWLSAGCINGATASLPGGGTQPPMFEWATVCPGLSFRYTHKVDVPVVSSLAAADSGAFAPALTGALDAAGVAWDEDIFPAATDARFLRDRGVPVYGMSVMTATPELLHTHDERLAIAAVADGVRVYEAVVGALAAVPLTAADGKEGGADHSEL